MYIDAEEVKNSMDLNIHQQIADFINKSVNDSQTMYLEDLENDLESLLEQEKIGNTISDVGIGIELAQKKVWELLEQFKKEQPENDTRWISCEKRYPKREGRVLLSFSNFSVPLVGRWEEDEEGGAFYIGDEEESCISQDLIVNAWMPLVKPYREG